MSLFTVCGQSLALTIHWLTDWACYKLLKEIMSQGNTAFLFQASYPAKIGRKADSFRGLCVELMLNGPVHHFRLQSLSLLSMVKPCTHDYKTHSSLH